MFRRTKTAPVPAETTALIMAGGASSRFGTPKGLAQLGGKPLVTWVATAAGAVARETAVVLEPGAPHEPWRDAVGATNVEATFSIVHDERLHGGPVAGLGAVASRVETPFTFILAVDMPLVRPDLLLGLMERLSGHDAVAFHIDGWWRPFPALWRTASLQEALSLAHVRSVQSMQGLLDLLDSRPLGKEFLSLFSTDGEELSSINTQDDLQHAEVALAARRAQAASAVRDAASTPDVDA